MFSHSKKDYYSVNCDIAIEANQQQRIYETALQISNPQNQDYDEGQDEQVYQSEMMAMPDVMSQEFQQTQMMIAEQMGEQAIRYDEIYYPRTDKRAIGKLPISLTPSPNSWQTVHLRGQHPPIPHFKAQGC